MDPTLPIRQTHTSGSEARRRLPRGKALSELSLQMHGVFLQYATFLNNSAYYFLFMIFDLGSSLFFLGSFQRSD